MIYAEMQRLPAGFLDHVIELRMYAQAKAANDSDPKGWNKSALRVLAKEIEFELVRTAK